jgi:hypothetical protein
MCWRLAAFPSSGPSAHRFSGVERAMLSDTFLITQATSTIAASNSSRSLADIFFEAHQEKHINTMKKPLIPPRRRTLQSSPGGVSLLSGQDSRRRQVGCRDSHQLFHTTANSATLKSGTTGNFFPLLFQNLTSSGRPFGLSQ